MTTQPKDGGPAFPRDQQEWGVPGMSLRDWFAGQATERDIEAHLTTCDAEGFGTGRYRTREQAKYAYADAMIAARGAA